MDQTEASFYLVKRDDRGEPIGLLHIPGDRVTVERDADGNPKRYLIDEERPPITRDNPGRWPYDALARQEWPHVPLQLARAYADEYVQTGQRP